MPGSSDDMFIQKLYNNFVNGNGSSRTGQKSAAKYFSKPRTSLTSFNVHHYAYVVTYEKDLFIDKNTDSLIPEHREMLLKSEVFQGVFFHWVTVQTVLVTVCVEQFTHLSKCL